MNTEVKLWYIVSVRYCRRNKHYSIGLGFTRQKAVGSPVELNIDRFRDLKKKLTGKSKVASKKIKGLSIPRTNDGNVMGDINHFLQMRG
jgi:hypothetical protein